MASSKEAEGLDTLVTEARRADTDYASRSTKDLVGLMNEEDASVPAAVAAVADELAAAIDAIVARLAAGGRLVYVGAGSSGRIAELDAEECEGTFSTEPGQVVALVAGAGLSSAALEAAAEAGALTVALTAVEGSALAGTADHDLAVVVGAEFVSGSTRLKAGTAQKLVLNTISTVTMIRLGKTYGDLMVDVRSSNAKLAARARRVVQLATGVSDDEAERALAEADGSAKVAVVSLLAGVDTQAARERLERASGHVTAALEQ